MDEVLSLSSTSEADFNYETQRSSNYTRSSLAAGINNRAFMVDDENNKPEKLVPKSSRKFRSKNSWDSGTELVDSKRRDSAGSNKYVVVRNIKLFTHFKMILFIYCPTECCILHTKSNDPYIS